MSDAQNALTVIPTNGADIYRMSTDAATICRALVTATAKEIQGRKYVCVEGWQAIAIAHGCAASSCNVERVEGGFRATGQVRRMDNGTVIAEAEGFVGEDEPVWFGGEGFAYGKPKTFPKRADFAIRAMAQTRAISRACRSAFAHVVIQIDKNLGTTPAEEMMGVIDHEPDTNSPARFAQEARDDGLTTETRSNYQVRKEAAQPKKDADWIANAISLCNSANTKDEIVTWWKANEKKRDEVEAAMPDDYRRFLSAYDLALERTSAKAA